MDSITQFVLGAAVSTVCLGKKIGPRKAALVGGVLGTLPDLDVFIPFDDPVDSFVYHRGWTHSFFVHALAAPLIGEGLVRLFKGLREHRYLVWATVFLCLATHAIIDAMTVYGTRIFWPLYPDPVGVGSVFIIDPLYSLPLIAVVVWAFFRRSWSARFGKWLVGVLVFTSAYMALSVGVQKHVEAEARDLFASQGSEPEKVMAIAAPFNILVWRVIGVHETHYDNLYISLLDQEGAADSYRHPRHPDLGACLEASPAFQKLAWFSRGYYKTEQIENKIVMSDLRMGLTPAYVFRFIIGEVDDNGARPLPPERIDAVVRFGEGDWEWFAERLMGRPSLRVSEAALTEQPAVAVAGSCQQDNHSTG